MVLVEELSVLVTEAEVMLVDSDPGAATAVLTTGAEAELEEEDPPPPPMTGVARCIRYA